MKRFAWTILACGLAATAVAAPPTKKAPAGKAPAVAPPTVGVAGIRVVGQGYGEDGSEAQPFNESPGVGLALVVQANSGGIITFDDDSSALGELTDSTGKSLLQNASIWPFPKITKDGKFLIVEMRSKGVPAEGATSVSAKGTLTVTTATGSKPVKVPGVRLENDKTFKAGAGVVTIEDVSAEEAQTSLGLRGPVSVMNSIRGVHFLDAKGQPIESSERGYSRSNDVMSKSYSVSTGEKVVTLELDMWQGLKQAAVPFNVTAGIGFAPAQ